MFGDGNCFLPSTVTLEIFKMLTPSCDGASRHFNNLRLVSLFFQNVIDENSRALYPRFAACFKREWAQHIARNATIAHLVRKISALESLEKAEKKVTEDFLELTAALKLEQELSSKGKISFDFFSVFSGTLVNFDRVPLTKLSRLQLMEMSEEQTVNFPLCCGEDPEGLFVAGEIQCIYQKRGKLDDKIRFIISASSYVEFSLFFKKVKVCPLGNIDGKEIFLRKKYTYLRELLNNGHIWKSGFNHQWSEFPKWEQLYRAKN